MKTFKAYISHAPTDGELAYKLKSAIEVLSYNRIKVNHSGQTGTIRDWRGFISQKLHTTDIFIFLNTYQKNDWDLRMYEVGYFSGQPKEGLFVICIKIPDTILPPQLEDVFNYESHLEGIKAFFDDLIFRGHFTNNERLNKFDDHDVKIIKERYTHDISRLFGIQLIKQDIYERRICINLQSYQNVLDKVNFEEVSIQGDPITMDLLDIRTSEVKWTTLEKNLKVLGSAGWLDDLKTCIDEFRFNKIPKGVLTPFKTADGRSFVPVLSSVEKIRNLYSGQNPKKADLPQRLFVIFIPKSPDDYLVSERILDESIMMVKPVFSPIKENIDSKLVFVLMPFNEEWSREVFDIIKTACKKMSLEVIRADDIFDPNIIILDIWRMINIAGIIIADLTTHNSNVLYELGIAHAIGKRVILICQAGSSALPFDVAAWRIIKYQTSTGGKKELTESLKRSLRSYNIDIS